MFNKDAWKTAKFPLVADTDGGYIWDSNGAMIAIIRGWGHLQKHYGGFDAHKAQDQRLHDIVNILNEAYSE